MRPNLVDGTVNEIVKARNQKDIQGKNGDSSNGREHGLKCTSSIDMVCGVMNFDEEIVCYRYNCSNGDGESWFENDHEDPHSNQMV